MQDHHTIPLTHTLSEYFKTQLEKACENLRPELEDDTLCYVGNVLTRFSRSEDFFLFEQGRYDIRPLALLYKDALESNNAHKRELYLRQLGDMSLFLGAIYAEQYAKRGIKKDYFAGMGSAAYDYLAANAIHYQDVFKQMSHYLARLIEVVAEVCAQSSPFDSGDVLKLYRRWQATKDKTLQAQLRHLGIDVNDGLIVH